MRSCARPAAPRRSVRRPALLPLALLALLATSLPAGCDPFAPATPEDSDPPPPWMVQPDVVQPNGPEPPPDAGPPDAGPEGLPDADPWAPRPSAVVVRSFDGVVLSPDGAWLLFQAAEGAGPACLVVVGLEDGTVRRPDALCGLRWIAVEPGGARAWLLGASGAEVFVVRLADLLVERTYETDDTYTVMEFSPEGDTLVLTNLPTDEWSESQYEWNTYDMDMRHVAVVRPATGVVHEQTFPFAVRDVAFSPVDGAVLVAMSWWKETGLPEAQVHFMDPDTGDASEHVIFPNCADELAIQPGGTLALLSPRQCFVHPVVLGPPAPDEDWPTPEDERQDWEEWDEGDPVSVIDLEERRFVGNLPGFGPVAISADGATAVAFSRRETLARQWNVFQRSLVGLVVIRLADLYWRVVEYGGAEPDFFFPGSGATLLLHDQEGGQDRVVALDAAGALAGPTATLRPLEGPPTHFERHAVTPDGATVYAAAYGALRRVPVGGGPIEDLALSYEVAHVFTRPQGDWLVVTEPELAAIHLLAADTGAQVRVIRP